MLITLDNFCTRLRCQKYLNPLLALVFSFTLYPGNTPLVFLFTVLDVAEFIFQKRIELVAVWYRSIETEQYRMLVPVLADQARLVITHAETPICVCKFNYLKLSTDVLF